MLQGYRNCERDIVHDDVHLRPERVGVQEYLPEATVVVEPHLQLDGHSLEFERDVCRSPPLGEGFTHQGMMPFAMALRMNVTVFSSSVIAIAR